MRAAIYLLPVGLMAWAAWADLASRTIPNWICIAVAFAGVVHRATEGPVPLAWSAAIAIMIFLALVPVHAVGALGGGDVKLAAAVALGLAPIDIHRFVIITVLAGGILAMAYLALRLLPAPALCAGEASVLQRVWTAERWRIRRRGSLPYGIAIACGGAWAILTSGG
jgi:prepilin peptidase CpaA